MEQQKQNTKRLENQIESDKIDELRSELEEVNQQKASLHKQLLEQETRHEEQNVNQVSKEVAEK